MSKRIKTKDPGVLYREADRIGGWGTEKVFYVVYKKCGADQVIPAQQLGERDP